ncbi:hypothetical protein Gotur_002686 [Gossypium turneri]
MMNISVLRKNSKLNLKEGGDL